MLGHGIDRHFQPDSLSSHRCDQTARRDDCIGIQGIDGREAETLIDALADHIVMPSFVYRHQWRVGDLLICGAPDAVSNLQWQTIREAKAKDKWETKGCAR
jgi:alpha-ketoglutarate-dependent taurine dioxygenase